jgi:mannosyltransferase OCH1-like enzyme
MSNQLIHDTTHNQMKHINWLIIINMHFTFILLYNFNFQKQIVYMIFSML